MNLFKTILIAIALCSSAMAQSPNNRTQQIARIAGCSPGAVVSEVKECKKEIAAGVVQNLNEDIPPLPMEVHSTTPMVAAAQATSSPLEIIRF